jgi:hypothetical protein
LNRHFADTDQNRDQNAKDGEKPLHWTDFSQTGLWLNGSYTQDPVL